ncbi:MAG: SDR family oxidoreductase [Gammaproteobacteria bacterium]|nr:SDR family oxidoreductase [Gammaproteobacteria bacterium]
MKLDLRGKHALVCGASQGIGRACALELAALGADVTVFGRNADSLAAVRAELDTALGQAHGLLVADFNDNAAVKRAAEELVLAKPVHILVNNTGGPAPGPAHTAEPAAFLAAFSQHLINNQNLVQTLLPGMKAAGYGRVINVISTSVKQPIPNLGVSNTVRGAVASWAKTLAGELGRFGITVNNVLPGATDTARLAAIIANKSAKTGKSPDEVIEEEKSGIPVGRFAQPEEFAYAVAFLASPSAAYITGINLPVDGGRTLCL